MIIGKFANFVRDHGLLATVLLVPFKLRLISLSLLGMMAASLNAKAKVDSTRIPINIPLIKASVKGGLLLGGYEKQERQLLRQYLPFTMPVIELGASIGVVSCIVDHLLIEPKQQVVVEPNPELLPVLEQNRAHNHCQFAIIESAISYTGSWVNFYANDGNIAGGLYQQQGKLMHVPACTLQSIVESVGFQRFNLICDIEGGEIDLIEHEIALLQQCVSLLIIEVHPAIVGQERIEAALMMLDQAGFGLVARIDDTYCLRQDAGQQTSP